MNEARRVLDLAVTEDQFLATLKQEAELRGWLFYHPWRSYHSAKGFPDVVMVRRGRLVFAELKKETGKTTPDQEKWLAALGEVAKHIYQYPDGAYLGQAIEVYLWRPSDWPEIEGVLK